MTAADPDAFGVDDDDTPPVSENRPTVRPRTVRARQRRKEEAAAKAAAVKAALGEGGRRARLEMVPPPAPPAAEAPPPDRASAELVALGEPPADPLAAQAWLHRAMVKATRDAILDPNLSAADRRKELRAFAKVAATLLPDARRFEAEELIKAKLMPAEMKRARGPELEPIPDVIEIDDGSEAGAG